MHTHAARLEHVTSSTVVKPSGAWRASVTRASIITIMDGAMAGKECRAGLTLGSAGKQALAGEPVLLAVGGLASAN